jgi:hypothetical protein
MNQRSLRSDKGLIQFMRRHRTISRYDADNYWMCDAYKTNFKESEKTEKGIRIDSRGKDILVFNLKYRSYE